MSQTKHRRPEKRQLGQFMTPVPLAQRLLKSIPVSRQTRVLEPSFGDGSFILALIEKFLPLYSGPVSARLDAILNSNIYGVEIDHRLYQRCLQKIADIWGYVPKAHNLVCADFFTHSFYPAHQDESAQQSDLFGTKLTFDFILGNPPFGGTIDLKLQDELDKKYGMRDGHKIKKETYAFFVVKCLDELAANGQLLFICSDTFLTIPTMRGLRRLLMEHCAVTVRELETFSEETTYPMVLLELTRRGRADFVTVDHRPILRNTMELTGNFSWAITDEYAKFFAGPKVGDYVVCSSGMTVGKNELFVREISDGEIVEPYDFVFYDEPITVAREIERARLHKLSSRALESVRLQELAGESRRNVRVVPKPVPERVRLPHPDYRFYNKATSHIIYAKPTHVIFWKDDGDAVLTFKKNGNWYLHGVGGQPYFGRSGLTWQLIATRLNVRYLPEGHILDSGGPCAFLRPRVDAEELYFILGWTCTELCTKLLKTVINHTQNIQSKDFERLPYPYWVSESGKRQASQRVRTLIERAMQGEHIHRTDSEIRALADLYLFPEDRQAPRVEPGKAGVSGASVTRVKRQPVLEAQPPPRPLFT